MRNTGGAADDAFTEAVRSELEPEFEIVRALGGGSLSTVFLAREPALQRLVAVKVLHRIAATRLKSLARFRREARSLARVSHPNVVSIYRVGDLPSGAPYLVMRYVPGPSLAERLEREGVLSVSEACRVLADVASALAAVHAHGIVHRDVRPGSILHDEVGGGAVLADFGLAAFRASDEEAHENITTTGHLVTDLRCSSPEILRGELATGASDVYSFGIAAFEALTGAGPYEASAARSPVAAHLREAPVTLAIRGVQAPALLEELLQACLAKEPARRPPPNELAAALQSLDRDEPASVAPTAGTGRGWAREALTEGPTEGPARYWMRMLGGLDLRLGSDSVTSILKQPKRVALLAYLAVGSESSFQRRDTLIGLFWSDSDLDSGRHALRQALYVLRRALGKDVLRTRGDDEVGLDPRLLTSDAARFRTLAAQGRAAAAMEYYGGDLLPGFYLDDAPEFERWLDVERVRLRRDAAELAWSLAAQAREESRSGDAARWARTAVDLDPFDERALHQLIQILGEQGDRGGALAAYEHFERRLAIEYAAEPSPETKSLIDRVRNRR